MASVWPCIFISKPAALQLACAQISSLFCIVAILDNLDILEFASCQGVVDDSELLHSTKYFHILV